MVKKIGLLCLLLSGGLLLLFLFQDTFAPRRARDYSYQLDESRPIWFITDLHYLSPTLFDGGQAFSYIEKTAAGKDLRYGYERMEALVEQVEEERPSLLVISGDLSFNGEKQSMEDLATFFSEVEEAGTQVLVIPGNHDIASGWARRFEGKKQLMTDQVRASEFSKIFADFGYQEASSQDPASLSYVAKTFENLWIMMLDSNIYTDGTGQGAPVANGRIKPKTLDWLEGELAKAEEAGVEVLPVLHHNLLDQHPLLTEGYTLDNASQVRALLVDYGTKLVVSGHTHVQNYRQEEGLTELVNSAFSVYPATIGEVRFVGHHLQYQQRTLAMDRWAARHQPQLADLAHHSTYLQAIFDRDTDIMVHTVMHNEGWYDGELADQIAQFMIPLNRAYFAGQPIDQEWLEDQVYPSSAYQALVQAEPRSFLMDYLQVIVERSQDRDVRGFELDW